MKNYNASLQGTNYRFAYGEGKKNFNFEIFYQVNDLEGKIKPDGIEDTMNMRTKSLGFLLDFKFHRKVYINLGYSFNKSEYSLESSSNPAYIASVLQSFGIDSNSTKTKGYFVGATVNLITSRKYDIYARVLRQNMSEISGEETIISIGLKLDINFWPTSRGR